MTKFGFTKTAEKIIAVTKDERGHLVSEYKKSYTVWTNEEKYPGKKFAFERFKMFKGDTRWCIHFIEILDETMAIEGTECAVAVISYALFESYMEEQKSNKKTEKPEWEPWGSWTSAYYD